MADSLKFLVVIFLLASLATQGSCLCRLQNPSDLGCLYADTIPTNRTVQGKPEWEVYVENLCLCDIEAIILSCPEFQTVEPVDEKRFLCKPSGTGIILGGYPLINGGYMKFSYAWDFAFEICPIQAHPVTPRCN